MATKLHHTALLLFVRDEREEAQLKPLARNQRASTALFRRFNAHVRQQAQRTGLPLFVVKGEQQRGQAFGERLANAIESVFACGYERVISLGNDCLQLQPRHILQAAQQLQQHDLVLGPAADGGVYLLGIAQSAYDRQAFLNLPWQTESLTAALRHYASHCLLPDWQEDIDDWQGFQRQLGRIAGDLRKRLLAITAISKPTSLDIPFTPSTLHLASAGLRAPPQ
ncbi:MAG: DUF2064 domain-containing protein [Bacteroidetes bacterium]|jgi:glycosyltransferase A (GT-A) superfamily protein (DUF2064 family)|nr:DUF2064 domain-containing protein [Bacteroidota bacterium]